MRRTLLYTYLCTVVITMIFASDAGSDYIEQVKRRIEQHGVDDFTKWAKDSMNRWKKEPLRIAITGKSGVGKSTFINTIRGLSRNQPEAAKTDSQKECTMVIGKYPDVKNPNLIYYDLPGVGTSNFPAEEYAKEMDLESFDFFIILSASRFTKDDLFLVTELSRLRKKFFFVRTKIDEAIRTEFEDMGGGFHEQTYLAEMKRICGEDLKSLPDKHPVYLISGRLGNYGRWDFPKLIQDLIDNSSGFKKEALIRTLSANSHATVDQKAASIENHIWIMAAASAGIALAPHPGLSIACDIILMTEEVYRYLREFGVDDEALTMLSKTLRMDPQTLISIIYGAQFFGEIPNTAVIKKLIMEKVGKYAVANAVEEFARFIPVVGQVVASGVSFGVVHQTLHYFLREVKSLAHKRVDQIVNHAS